MQPKPNVSALTFGKYFTDHMLKIFYHEALGGWQTPEITPLENLILHPAAKVLHYAIEVKYINTLKQNYAIMKTFGSVVRRF